MSATIPPARRLRRRRRRRRQQSQWQGRSRYLWCAHRQQRWGRGRRCRRRGQRRLRRKQGWGRRRGKPRGSAVGLLEPVHARAAAAARRRRHLESRRESPRVIEIARPRRSCCIGLAAASFHSYDSTSALYVGEALGYLPYLPDLPPISPNLLDTYRASSTTSSPDLARSPPISPDLPQSPRHVPRELARPPSPRVGSEVTSPVASHWGWIRGPTSEGRLPTFRRSATAQASAATCSRTRGGCSRCRRASSCRVSWPLARARRTALSRPQPLSDGASTYRRAPRRLAE